MLNYANTRFFKTVDRVLADGVGIKEEGFTLALVQEEGELRARLSTGTSGEIFGGFACSTNLPTTFSTKVVEIGELDDLTVQLDRTPQSAQILVKVGGVKLTVETGTEAPTADTSVVLTPANTLLFHGEAEGKAVLIQYHYELLASEAVAETGDYFGGVGNSPASVMGVVGAVIEGTISTNLFAASDDWTGVIHPKMGAGGMLRASGSGTELTNVKVVQVPNSGSPFLTVEVGN